jgi:CcmD family protein
MLDYAVSIKYMIAGYLIIFLVIGIFITSLILRWKKLKREQEYLITLDPSKGK